MQPTSCCHVQLPVRMSNSQGGMAGAHTGLVLLAFFSDLTASSWAFLFSASLLACEKEGELRIGSRVSREGCISSLTGASLSRVSRKANKQITRDPNLYLTSGGKNRSPINCPYSTFYGPQNFQLGDSRSTLAQIPLKPLLKASREGTWRRLLPGPQVMPLWRPQYTIALFFSSFPACPSSIL